jgi:hypothetical protein
MGPKILGWVPEEQWTRGLQNACDKDVCHPSLEGTWNHLTSLKFSCRVAALFTAGAVALTSHFVVERVTRIELA